METTSKWRRFWQKLWSLVWVLLALFLIFGLITFLFSERSKVELRVGAIEKSDKIQDDRLTALEKESEAQKSVTTNLALDIQATSEGLAALSGVVGKCRCCQPPRPRVKRKKAPPKVAPRPPPVVEKKVEESKASFWDTATYQEEVIETVVVEPKKEVVQQFVILQAPVRDTSHFVSSGHGYRHWGSNSVVTPAPVVNNYYTTPPAPRQLSGRTDPATPTAAPRLSGETRPATRGLSGSTGNAQ